MECRRGVGSEEGLQKEEMLGGVLRRVLREASKKTKAGFLWLRIMEETIIEREIDYCSIG